jgi:hypothetical protein
MANTKTKKKTISIKKGTKKDVLLEDKTRYLENSKNPIYKKYLVEFENFFKEKKKSDKAKRKGDTYEYLNDKLIKTSSSNKKVIKLPNYILTNTSLDNIDYKMNEISKELHYIKDLIDFTGEEEVPKEIITRFQELKKEFTNLETDKKNQLDSLNEINELETEESKAEKQMLINMEERKNRDLYILIKEKHTVDTDDTDETTLKEYFESKKNIQKMKEEPKKMKEINYLIDKLPIIEK